VLVCVCVVVRARARLCLSSAGTVELQSPEVLAISVACPHLSLLFPLPRCLPSRHARALCRLADLLRGRRFFNRLLRRLLWYRALELPLQLPIALALAVD